MKEWKPYDLAVVQHEDYRHCGQVISKPIGNGGILVQMVPDDPLTMKEVAVSSLQQPFAKYKWVQYAEVSGGGSFPVDMLRYDFACPANFNLSQDDRGRYVTSHIEGWEAAYGGGDRLYVARCTERKEQEWTAARWNSFGWYVKPLKTLKLASAK
jgi:hypothetical protein